MNDLAIISVVLGGVCVAAYGCMLLAPSPTREWLRRFPRSRPAAWVLTLVVLAYMLVVKGCILIVAPYKFRKGAEALFLNPARARWGGATGVALGLTLAILGFAVY